MKFTAKTKNKNYNNFFENLLQITSAGVICFLLLNPLIVSARSYEPENIISDAELFDKNSLTQKAIQVFLERENSVLARYSQIVNGSAKKASQIIYEISQQQNINPKFLLTTLEKEQGLVSKSQATEKALDWATGYSCYGGSCNSKYKGFFNQVESAAIVQNIYKAKASGYSFQVNKTTKTYDGYYLKPKNQATANLFIYTPYVGYSPELGVLDPFGGNRLFWRIWNRYFTKKYFPDGLAIKNNGNYYLIEKNKARKFSSREIYLTYFEEDEAYFISDDAFKYYDTGLPIDLARNMLIKSPTSGQIYLIADDFTKRPVLNNNALALISDFRLAAAENEIKTGSAEQLGHFIEGATISENSKYPQGKLFKDESGNIFYVKDGIKKSVDPMVWQIKYNSAEPELVTATYLENFLSSTPDKLPDGSIVKNDGKYYLIAGNGQRMRFDNVDFVSKIYGPDKLAAASSVSTSLLEVHTAGEVIDFMDDTVKESAVKTAPSSSGQQFSAQFYAMEPDGLILLNGESKTATIKFKNNGSSSWTAETVWLKALNQDGSDSSFGPAEKFYLSEAQIAADGIGTFNVSLTAPYTPGLNEVIFQLYYDNSGTETKFSSGSVGKFIMVKAGETGEVVSHNLPVAVKNNWQPVTIDIKIKNTSKDTVWTAKYTKLKIYDEKGNLSRFYDPGDWLSKDIAAIPLRTKTVKPGETAEFQFTLKVKGVNPDMYGHKLVLYLEDLEKQVALDGTFSYIRLMRVDK
ncbi:hypothetical protein C4569_04000 [Candidatus Parcubacteria bacterium]|nr:MAG: hypothetical protein C4569_04000 [Candidatus Parcubacteria bacterium]